MSKNGIGKNSKNQGTSKKDVFFLEQIASRGGMIFKDRYIKKGDGYESCLLVYGYPKRNRLFWLSRLTNIEESIVTIDLASSDNENLIYNINQALGEHESRYLRDKKVTDSKSAQNRYLELTELYDAIYEGEIVKDVLTRIYLSARTLPELERKVAATLMDLEGAGFKATVHLGLLEDDFKALQRPLGEQKKHANVPLYNKEITASTLSAGIHTHFTKIHDPQGTYYGQCLYSEGKVIFDPFHIDSTRKFYNSVVLGKMGSGKSTLLKKMALSELAKGNRVRVFDASGEFYSMANDFGGAYLSLDGTDNRINPLEVYATSNDKDKNKGENDRISFQNHMAKLEVFFSYLLPGLDSSEIAELLGFLYTYYIFRGLITEDNFEGVCDYEPERYGLLSDFLRFLRTFISEEASSEVKKSRAESLRLNLNKIILSYGNIFNGISSFNVRDKNLVVFNVKGVANLPKEIFEALLFNVLNILWNEMLSNVKFGADVANEDETNRKYLLILDESHRLINSSSPDSTIRFYENFMRESRKYLAGIVLTSHLLDDFGDTADGRMSKLFQLTQYKFIFKQDISSKKTFENVFSKELTNSEIELLPVLEVGECILSISGFANISFKVSLGFEEEKKYLITGGI
ncbi:MAG: hypothetical protein GX046_05820 [Tissierellia bacterium]|nr:hypothetical protein [Tissierellia bacterium]